VFLIVLILNFIVLIVLSVHIVLYKLLYKEIRIPFNYRKFLLKCNVNVNVITRLGLLTS